MDCQTFDLKLRVASFLSENSECPEYWRGFQYGLQRYFYGKEFGTDEQHAIRMKALDSPLESYQDAGRGYRDGFLRHDPEV